jgi:hypothetical protein
MRRHADNLQRTREKQKSLRTKARSGTRWSRALLAAWLLGISGLVARVACARPPAPVAAPLPALNLAHFDHLFAETTLDGKPVGVMRIYSSYPDYTYAIEPREGYACVDDAARAIVLLAGLPGAERDSHRMRQLELLTRFVLAMQNANGYFNNFLWADGRINTTYYTTVAELNWWSLRALWGLESAYRVIPRDSPLREEVRSSTARLVANLQRDLATGERHTRIVSGFRVPTWLPAGSGADEAAVAVLGLLPHYARTHDAQTRTLIVALAEGMEQMQAGDRGHFPYGLHLSSQNTWHGWGSDQALALLLAGDQLKRRDFITSALAEIDGFYPYAMRQCEIASLVLANQGDRVVVLREQRYPQIAYAQGAMVRAAVEAYHVTGNHRYLAEGQQIFSWFTQPHGNQPAAYDPASGRVADGLIGRDMLNRNSGAESTVEGLMALDALRTQGRG